MLLFYVCVCFFPLFFTCKTYFHLNVYTDSLNKAESEKESSRHCYYCL